jgi:hypothetical protein
MLVEREFPKHDIFSHTAAGQPWVNMEWLAQIMLALTYDWSGWHGLILLCGLVIRPVSSRVSSLKSGLKLLHPRSGDGSRGDRMV